MLAIMVVSSKISIKVTLQNKPILLSLFLAILNIFYTDKYETWFEYKFLKLHQVEFILQFYGIRILLIIASSLLTYTTSPTMITDGLERLLSPLKFMKNSVHTVAMMMTIALRFIPTLIEEFEKIKNAQKARGADLDSGGLIQRSKALVPIFIPLFITSFRRAYELAFAMECRCYNGGEGRTRMKKMKLKKVDFVALFFIVAMCVAVIMLNMNFTFALIR